MRIGLILPGNIWFSPYAKIYTSILDENSINYDIVSWNRDGQDKKTGYQFEYNQNNDASRCSKLFSYLKYLSFIKQTILNQKFDKLIIFGPQLAILLEPFLIKHYKNKYLFDYRDLSIEQITIFKRRFKNILKNSCGNIISSPGFKKCLPKNFKYYLSHNFDINIVQNNLDSKEPINNITPLNILTIGGIRDYDSNAAIIQALSNNRAFQMSFVGRGHCAKPLEDFSKSINTQNIEFKGFYQKEDEPQYIKKSHFLNIYYPKIISHSTALSNRFYNALIYKRPMIVTSNSIQGDYVEKYNLGISINDTENLDEKLKSWMSDMNYEQFCDRCNSLLKSFISDYKEFEDLVKGFIKN